MNRIFLSRIVYIDDESQTFETIVSSKYILYIHIYIIRYICLYVYFHQSEDNLIDFSLCSVLTLHRTLKTDLIDR